MSSYSKIVIKIYHLTIFKNHDFLFELKKILYFILYIYFIDSFIKIIFFKNKFFILIQIFRNYRLNKLIKFKYIDVYYIKNDDEKKTRDFAIKRFRLIY